MAPYGTTKTNAPALSPDGTQVQVTEREIATTESSFLLPDNAIQDAEQEVKTGQRWKAKLLAFHEKNTGLILIFTAQLFSSIMSMCARLLATAFETKLHALQIIFARMLVTGVIGSLYIWAKKVPDLPFGPPGVRRLLVLRGIFGSTGLFGLYYGLSYLDIADSTLITFLVPTLTAFICWVALGEPFTVNEALAGLVAFSGVLFIARPAFLFHQDDPTGSSSLQTQDSGLLPPPPVSAAERSLAIVIAVLGTFFAASAYATIRVIGKRAHSLISVNYFSVIATLGSFAIIMLHPDLEFDIPRSGLQWVVMISLGLSGFLFQVLLTEGLQREKAGRATNLMYTQLVFALILDRLIWDTVPPLTSFIGAVLIIGAALWVTLQKKAPEPKARLLSDEERPVGGPSS